MVSKRGSVSQNFALSVRCSIHSSLRCISNAETPPSCVPVARRVAPRSKRADRGVSVTCLSWSSPSCCGCIEGALSAPMPIAGIVLGTRVRPSASRCSGPNGSTAKCDRPTWEDARAQNSPVALVSLSAPCFAGPLRGVGVAARARLAEPLAWMRLPGARGIVRTHGLSTWTAASPWRPARDDVLRMSSPG